jgi:hypothetical protein
MGRIYARYQTELANQYLCYSYRIRESHNDYRPRPIVNNRCWAVSRSFMNRGVESTGYGEEFSAEEYRTRVTYGAEAESRV